MNLSGIILRYLYIVVLSVWVIALPQYHHSIPEDQSTDLELSYGESGYLEQPNNLCLLGHGSSVHTAIIYGYGHPGTDLLFHKFFFPDLYWKNFGAAALSFLAAVNIKSGATDYIFPFHFFW
ncbi:MAG TPA: hypothetical protein VKX33_13695 [Cyclobacteriaceae bacterium]|nr:hypothetical protein [Cyclobacteriaceae bacterium]